MLRYWVAGAAALIASACASPATASVSLKGLRAPAATKANPTFVQGQPAEIIVSQQFLLHSENTGDDYLIQVAIPIWEPGPGTLDLTAETVDRMFPKRDAPAVYLLDGGSDFPLYVAHRTQQFIVGVQPVFATWRELNDDRWRDLAHFPVAGQPTSGGGGKLAAFITQELRPFIEARFPVDPNKAVLSGYSLGGMFALRVLADNPAAFAGYIIGDPSSFDPGVYDGLRENASKMSGQRVYFGSSESVRDDVKAVRDQLRAALTGANLVIERREFIGETHGTANAFVAQKGLAWMFSAPSLRAAPSQLGRQ